METLFRNATIIAMDASHGSVPFAGDVLVTLGRITAIGSGLAAPDGADVIDASDKLLMPGLVNAHTHSSEMFFRGRYEKLPLELWLLYAYPLLRGPAISKRLIYLRSLLLAMESIHNGVTTVVDHFFDPPTHDLERLGAAVQAYDDIGLRATVASAVMDIHPLDALPHGRQIVPQRLQDLLQFGPPISPAAYTDYCKSAVAAFHGRKGRISFMVAPSAPQRCSPAMMLACRDFALAAGVPYHSHVLETKTQAVTGRLLFGKSLIAYMHDLGLLHRGTTIAHSVWVDAIDIAILGKTGCSVVHNAIANLKLGSGVAPVRQLLDAGVTIALGTDGACSNDTVRLFDVMRVAALLHSGMGSDPERWLSSSEILHMATIGGARSALLDRETGSIEVGKSADLIVLDRKSLSFTPQNTIANHLVYAENGSSIGLVMVAGEIVCRDGHLTRIDEASILAEIREEMTGYLATHTAVEDRNRVFHAAFVEIHWRANAEVTATNRYISEPVS